MWTCWKLQGVGAGLFECMWSFGYFVEGCLLGWLHRANHTPSSGVDVSGTRSFDFEVMLHTKVMGCLSAPSLPAVRSDKFHDVGTLLLYLKLIEPL